MNTRAQQRTEQREPLRRRRSTTMPTFYIDPASIPPGMDYNWKRLTFAGQEDKEHQIGLAENGWIPVPAKRHPDKAGRDADPDSAIIRGGQILMERPSELTREARDEHTAQSREQIRNQFLRLGQTERGMPRTKPKAKRTFEAPPPQASDEA